MQPRISASLIAVCIFAFDRWTKWLVESKLGYWDTYPVIPGIFNLVHTRNRGAAFGMLATAPETIRVLVLVVASMGVLALICWMLWQATRAGQIASLVQRTALSLVLGGAAGNLYDRILKGSVTDFLQVFLGSYEWPSFNVADSAICVGACLMALDLFQTKPSQNKKVQSHAPETR